MKPRLLDMFCGAGGCSMGYLRAGFEVTGVDLHPQPHYPFRFIQADAIAYCRKHGHEYDVIHASPPCQAYSITKNLKTAKTSHPDLVAATRAALIRTRKPYVIENVPGSPLINPLMLCGSMFGLGVIRHRLFESSPPHMVRPGRMQTQCGSSHVVEIPEKRTVGREIVRVYRGRGSIISDAGGSKSHGDKLDVTR
jgi:hypothetical protein